MNVMEVHAKTLVKVTLTHSILSIVIPEVKFSVKDPIVDIKVI